MYIKKILMVVPYSYLLVSFFFFVLLHLSPNLPDPAVKTDASPQVSYIKHVRA